MTFDNTKSHKKPGFTLPLENTFLEKPQGGGGSNQPPPPPFQLYDICIGQLHESCYFVEGEWKFEEGKVSKFLVTKGLFLSFLSSHKGKPWMQLDRQAHFYSLI